MSQFLYSIPSRETILEALRAAKGPIAPNDLFKKLSVKKPEQEGCLKRLQAMERDGQIRANQQGSFELQNTAQFIAGRVQAHRDGYGFLIREDGEADLFFPHQEMQKMMHNDRVLARLVGQDRRGRLEGHVVEITERANQYVIGRLLEESGVLLVAPEDKRIGRDIVIVPGGQGKARVGQVVSVELTRFPDRMSAPAGKVVEILGELDDPGMEIEIAVRKFGLPHRFSKTVEAHAAKLPDKVTAADAKGRIDLRDVPLVTIDGEDARDFDDAVYCEPIRLGRSNGFRLVVAIADVAHYVKAHDALDIEALARSTSVYFPRRVIPMLPEKLSNGLCSLNPHVDRCALVCDMTLTAQGKIKAYQFYPALIHSAARFTYTAVADILAHPNGLEAKCHPDLVPHLQNLYGVYQAFAGARKKRGALDFDTVETYIVCNAQGKIEKIVPRERNEAHKLIEECMLAANVCAADFLKLHDHAGLYRVHATPSEEKLTSLRTFLRDLGLTLGGGAEPQASDYAALLTQIHERPDAQILQTMLLRSMQQAVYSPDNIGHFGLAYEAYAHFTSPIRRYPDLLTHRALHAIIRGEQYKPTIPSEVELNRTLPASVRTTKDEEKKKSTKKAAPKGSQKSAHQHPEQATWQMLGHHCSANERRADEASRDVEAWLKCYFMRDKLGEEFDGMVNGIAPFGLFIQLDKLFVEGLVHVTELGADYFQYDEIKNELRGERTGQRYRLFDRVRVQVMRVDLNARKIDFQLVSAEQKKGASNKTPTERAGSKVEPKAKKLAKAATKKVAEPAAKSSAARRPAVRRRTSRKVKK